VGNNHLQQVGEGEIIYLGTVFTVTGWDQLPCWGEKPAFVRGEGYVQQGFSSGSMKKHTFLIGADMLPG
jgi:hypothetical protein